MHIGIIGAGLAGLACGERLRQAGCDVTLYDKGRGAGGRMATRRVTTEQGDASFDHGAQYFTARDMAFRAQVAAWHEAGLVAPWPASGTHAWVGAPSMNAPVRHLAGKANVHWSVQVAGLTQVDGAWAIQGTAFDAVLVAVPAEQVVPLLKPWAPEIAQAAAATKSQPCWTVMAAFAERLSPSTDTMREQGIIGWAARNSAKPGRSGPESWVIQAGPEWSQAHLEEAAEAVLPQILSAFAQILGAPLPPTLVASAHRWRYAQCGACAAGEGAIWDAALRLGACGDWLLGPRVESAWLSGRRLAEQVIATAHEGGQ